MNEPAARAQDAPLPPPWPTTDFEALTRRQSIVAWTVGALVGTIVAAAAIVALVLDLI